MHPRLQPHAPEAAAPSIRGCNPDVASASAASHPSLQAALVISGILGIFVFHEIVERPAIVVFFLCPGPSQKVSPSATIELATRLEAPSRLCTAALSAPEQSLGRMDPAVPPRASELPPKMLVSLRLAIQGRWPGGCGRRAARPLRPRDWDHASGTSLNALCRICYNCRPKQNHLLIFAYGGGQNWSTTLEYAGPRLFLHLQKQRKLYVQVI